MSTGYERYDYAWRTPGWNVQNPTMPDAFLDGYLTPGLPDDVALVRVFGSFLELESGRPLSGVFRLRVDQSLVYLPTGEQVMGGGFRPLRFRNGGFSVYLPATDDPQLVPDFVYKARLTVRGKAQEFEFALPADEPEVNVRTLIERWNAGGVSGGTLEGGEVPSPLEINLTTGGAFNWTVSTDDPWADDATVQLVFANGTTWDAVVDETTATFSEDSDESDTIPGGTGVHLVVDGDNVWAVGSVVRHG